MNLKKEDIYNQYSIDEIDHEVFGDSPEAYQEGMQYDQELMNSFKKGMEKLNKLGDKEAVAYVKEFVKKIESMMLEKRKSK